MYSRILAALTFSTVCLAQCSQDMVRGAWVASYVGTMMVAPAGSTTPVATPAAQLFVEKIDYQGRLNGTFYASVGGQISSGTLSGNIQVNPDCTASDTFTMSAAGTGPLPGSGSERLFVVGRGDQMRGMTTKGLLGSQAGITYYRRIAWSDPQCTQDMLHGAYGVSWEGAFVMTPPGQSQPVALPYSQIGAGAYDYAGKGSGVATMSLGGNIIPSTLPAVTVTINADCTGSLKYKGGAFQIVVLNSGDELLGFGLQITGGSPIMIGKFNRLSAVPVQPNW